MWKLFGPHFQQSEKIATVVIVPLYASIREERHTSSRMRKDFERQCLITCISYFLYNILVCFHKMCCSSAEHNKLCYLKSLCSISNLSESVRNKYDELYVSSQTHKGVHRQKQFNNLSKSEIVFMRTIYIEFLKGQHTLFCTFLSC